jgi:hypothetical protein
VDAPQPETGVAGSNRSSWAARTWQGIPALGAFVLLLCQVLLPWTVNHFVTTDGPAHVYGASVLRELLFQPDSSMYSPVYQIQRMAVPNSIASLLLAGGSALVGTAHAEQLLTSLIALIGFFGLWYLSRALAPGWSTWTPLFNFPVQTWFMRMGFYSFVLGMLLVPFAAGYYIRRAGRFGWRNALVLAAGFILLFFTHLIAVGMAMAAVGLVASWLAGASRDLPLRTRIMEGGLVMASMIPAGLLGLLYTRSGVGIPLPPGTGTDWHFSGMVFTTAPGFFGHQYFLRAAIALYIGAAVLAMKRSEWRSARGGILLSSIVAFAGYVFLPDEGLGGSIVKIRFLWALFLFGLPLAASVARLRRMRVPVALCVFFFLSWNFVATHSQLKRLSKAVESYVAAASAIPGNVRVVRILYDAPNAATSYGYEDGAEAPFRHVDAWLAARRHQLDVTSYEPLNEIFPIIYKAATHEERRQLWDMAGGGPGAEKTLDWVFAGSPVDYVMVVGEEGATVNVRRGMPAMLAYLNSRMIPMAQSSDGLLRIYRSATGPP